MRRNVIASRSSMNVTLITRLLGMTITVFILILTVKSELLEFKIISWQLILSIPILLLALVTNTKILNLGTFKIHKTFNLFVSSIALALIFNTIGMIVSIYVSALLGILYFMLFILGYTYFMIVDWEHGKIHNEFIIITLLLLFGLLPSLFIL